MKFYQTPNALMPIGRIKFEKYDVFAGCVYGVYKTENADEIATLDGLVAANKLFSITEAQYANCLKKKRRDFGELTHLNMPVPRVLESIKGQSAAIVTETAAQETAVSVPTSALETAESALLVESPSQPATPVAPPVTAVPEAILSEAKPEPKSGKRK